MVQVLYCALIPEDRQIEVDDLFQTTIRDYYRIANSAATADVVSMLQQAQQVGPNPLPAIGSPYSGPSGAGTDSYSLCKRYRFRLQDRQAPEKWTVEVEFSADTADQSNENINPTYDSPVVSWGNVQIEQSIQYDANGDLTANSTGDPFDPPVQVRQGLLTLTVQTNEPTFRSDLAAPASEGGLLFSYNSDPMWGYDEGQIQLVQFTGVQQRKNSFNYFAVTKVFNIDTRENYGFKDVRYLDQGYRVLDSNNKPVLARDPNQLAPFTKPALLDGTGHLLNGTGAVSPGFGTDPQYMVYQPYYAADWSDLVLPVDPTQPYGGGSNQ